LKNVVVKTIPYRTKSGDVFQIPGAWCISSKPSSNNEDDEEEVEVEGDGDKTPLSTTNHDEEEDDTDNESDFPHTTIGASGSDRFVVRNEFGHARIQHFIRYLEMHTDRSNDGKDTMEVGGHCVLPPVIFDYCLSQHWGWKHPFGGQFHPITGTIIPANTLLFPAPRNEEELEIVWKLVQTSYVWALDNNTTTTDSTANTTMNSSQEDE